MTTSCLLAIATITPGTDYRSNRLSNTLIQHASQLTAKKRAEYLVGRILLAELLFRATGINQLPKMVRGERGRPFFKERQLPDFNISHSKNYVMVALTLTGEVGIDIEAIRPRERLQHIAHHSFSVKEYQWMMSFPTELQANAFWQLWTMREAVLKLTGKGIGGMKTLEMDPAIGQLKLTDQHEINCWSCQNEAYYWALATNQMINRQDIQLWQASSDLTTLTTTELPNLHYFHPRQEKGNRPPI